MAASRPTSFILGLLLGLLLLGLVAFISPPGETRLEEPVERATTTTTTTTEDEEEEEEDEEPRNAMIKKLDDEIGMLEQAGALSEQTAALGTAGQEQSEAVAVIVEPVARIADFGQTPGSVVKLIQTPGILPHSYVSAVKASEVNSPLDLPRVFPVDPETFALDQNAIKVCLFNRTPRQRSLFATNVLSMFGSGKFNYVSMESTDCQHHGTCKSPEEARRHTECDPKKNPMVYLLERIKCCQHDRFDKVLERAKEFWDIVVASGDEFCRATSASGKAHYRMYFGPEVVSIQSLPSMNDIMGISRSRFENVLPLKTSSFPLYLPLGPREEFRRVKPKHVILAPDRKYLFNFAGSMTSISRKRLNTELLNLHIPNTISFTHITQEWSKEITEKNGYLLPSEYRKVMINSTFTLCPQGHNPEAYRIFEACEAGSIPIVVLDASYQLHECKNAFLPLIESGAPFVFLNGWKGLSAYLKRVVSNPQLLLQMQINVMEWYSKYMQTIALEFEKRLMDRFTRRQTGTRSS